MGAWLRRRTEIELGAEPSLRGERDPIAVFRIDGIVEGSLPKLDSRLTEALDESVRIQIRTAPHDGGAGERVVMNLDDVVAVAAPPRPLSPYRVNRRHHAVEINAGPYRIRGIAHLPPGADPERYVASSPRSWLPLTDCTVGTVSDEWAVDVVIVNLDHASREKRAYHAPPSR